MTVFAGGFAVLVTPKAISAPVYASSDHPPPEIWYRAYRTAQSAGGAGLGDTLEISQRVIVPDTNGFVGFEFYGGRGAFVGTQGHFDVNLPDGFQPYYEQISPEVTRNQGITGRFALNDNIPVAQRTPISVTPGFGNAFTVVFDLLGVYYFRVNMVCNDADFNKIEDEDIITFEFKMVAGIEPPRFRAEFPQLPATGFGQERNVVTVNPNRITNPSEFVLFLTFAHAGGFQPANVRLHDHNGLSQSSIPFLQVTHQIYRRAVGDERRDAEGYFLTGTHPQDGERVRVDRFEIRIRQGHTLPTNVTYNEITIRVTHDGYDDLNSLGQPSPVAHGTSSAALPVTIIFENAPSPPGFPWMLLIGSIGAVAALGAGLYGVNKLLLASQVRTAAKKRREQEQLELKRQQQRNNV